MYGWYVDADNHAGLAMDEFSNRWTLFERVRGTRYASAVDVAKVLPNTRYDVRLVFDGTRYTAAVDGTPLLQLATHGTPDGSAALGVAGASARFEQLRVSAIAAVPVPADPEVVFDDGFEPADPPNLSQCVLDD